MWVLFSFNASKKTKYAAEISLQIVLCSSTYCRWVSSCFLAVGYLVEIRTEIMVRWVPFKMSVLWFFLLKQGEIDWLNIKAVENVPFCSWCMNMWTEHYLKSIVIIWYINGSVYIYIYGIYRLPLIVYIYRLPYLYIYITLWESIYTYRYSQ